MIWGCSHFRKLPFPWLKILFSSWFRMLRCHRCTGTVGMKSPVNLLQQTWPSFMDVSQTCQPACVWIHRRSWIGWNRFKVVCFLYSIVWIGVCYIQLRCRHSKIIDTWGKGHLQQNPAVMGREETYWIRWTYNSPSYLQLDRMIHAPWCSFSLLRKLLTSSFFFPPGAGNPGKLRGWPDLIRVGSEDEDLGPSAPSGPSSRQKGRPKFQWSWPTACGERLIKVMWETQSQYILKYPNMVYIPRP